jgi:hypothetical protein
MATVNEHIPRVIHINTAHLRGRKDQARIIRIDRIPGSVWGNPYRTGQIFVEGEAIVRYRSKLQAIQLYRELMHSRLAGRPGPTLPRYNPLTGKRYGWGKAGVGPEPMEVVREANMWAERLRGLRGKLLACWCAPEACHGDVLVEYYIALYGREEPSEDGEGSEPARDVEQDERGMGEG